MSFWGWMRENYLQWIKRPSLNFTMFFVGAAGSAVAFSAGLYFMLSENVSLTLIFFCLSGVGFVLGNYGWYRKFAKEAEGSRTLGDTET